MITEITLTDVQDFIVRHVKDSAEFKATSDAILGEDINFYRGADIKRYVETLPYYTAYKFNSQKSEGNDSRWIVQFVIGISGEAEPIVDNGVTIWEATDKVEQLAVKALDVIHEGVLDGSLGGICLLRIADENILITEVGEALDVQAIVTLRLETYSIL